MSAAMKVIDVDDLGMPSMIVRTATAIAGGVDLLLLDAALTVDQRTTILTRLLETIEG